MSSMYKTIAWFCLICVCTANIEYNEKRNAEIYETSIRGDDEINHRSKRNLTLREIYRRDMLSKGIFNINYFDS